MSERALTKDALQKIGKEILLKGWVAARRDHGKLIFLDVRDRWGTVQIVCNPKNAELLKEAERVRPEWVVSIKGIVKERPKGMVNPDIATGTIEIEAQELAVINEAQTPPFSLDTDGYEIGEERRLQYRYLDLRRPRMQKNIWVRNAVASYMRQYLSEQDFIEIDTPILTKTTPEGARDFLIPSRLQQGKFYALPQSPQQYKQLLMVAGVERYFQLARCFRD